MRRTHARMPARRQKLALVLVSLTALPGSCLAQTAAHSHPSGGPNAPGGRNAAPGDASPHDPDTRVLAFAGHDTTLDALAGHYGIDWHFSDQPDRTAPDTTLAFERWQKPDGEIVYRARVFHQSLASLRAGQGNPNPPQDVTQVPSR